MIRLARVEDSAGITDIWNVEATATTATTDTEPRTPAAQAAWLASHTEDYPVVVAVEADEVVAFGSLSPYRPRPSYRWTVEDSVYVRDGYRGKGIGAGILAELLTRARITSENAPSLALHRRHGFQRAGYERQAAFKLDRWLDVVTLQLLL